MNVMNRKWMILLLLLLGTAFVSGCAPRATVMVYNEAKEAFQRATIAGVKKCAPCQYATAEANLALADHEMKYYWRELEDLAFTLTNCQGQVFRSSQSHALR